MFTEIVSLLTQLRTALPPGFGFKKHGTEYEVLVALSLAHELQKPTYNTTVEICDHAGGTTTQFVIRGGPGKIHSAAANAPRPGFIKLTYSGRSRVRRIFEIHNSVQFEGRSASKHEQDVSVLREQVGKAIRGLSEGGYPSSVDLTASIECKDLVINAGVGIARGSLGNAFELSPQRSRGGSYRQAFSRTRMFAVAVRGPMTPGGEAVLKHYGVRAYPNAGVRSRGLAKLVREVARRIHKEMKRR